jgi:hypothetical protein
VVDLPRAPRFVGDELWRHVRWRALDGRQHFR